MGAGYGLAVRETAAVAAVRVISMPFHSGAPEVGMGRGPGVLLGEHGLAEALRDGGADVSVEEVPAAPEVEYEAARIFELDARLAARVGAAVAEGAFPLVLSGNCNCSLGIVAGLAPVRPAVVWLDAHADFNTAETTPSGFIDGTALSILTGSAWQALRAAKLPELVPVAEADVVLAGARDLDDAERERLAATSVAWVRPGEPLAPALDALAERREDLYLHVDLDVLDASEGRANQFAAPGGPRLDEVLETIAALLERFVVRAAALTAYDPACDPEGEMGSKAVRVAKALTGGRAEHVTA